MNVLSRAPTKLIMAWQWKMYSFRRCSLARDCFRIVGCYIKYFLMVGVCRYNRACRGRRVRQIVCVFWRVFVENQQNPYPLNCFESNVWKFTANKHIAYPQICFMITNTKTNLLLYMSLVSFIIVVADHNYYCWSFVVELY